MAMIRVRDNLILNLDSIEKVQVSYRTDFVPNTKIVLKVVLVLNLRDGSTECIEHIIDTIPISMLRKSLAFECNDALSGVWLSANYNNKLSKCAKSFDRTDAAEEIERLILNLFNIYSSTHPEEGSSCHDQMFTEYLRSRNIGMRDGLYTEFVETCKTQYNIILDACNKVMEEIVEEEFNRIHNNQQSIEIKELNSFSADIIKDITCEYYAEMSYTGVDMVYKIHFATNEHGKCYTIAKFSEMPIRRCRRWLTEKDCSATYRRLDSMNWSDMFLLPPTLDGEAYEELTRIGVQLFKEYLVWEDMKTKSFEEYLAYLFDFIVLQSKQLGKVTFIYKELCELIKGETQSQYVESLSLQLVNKYGKDDIAKGKVIC